MIRATVKDYLDRIESEELSKPASMRRTIPRQVDLAEAAGVAPQAISRWLNMGHHAPLNRKYMDGIIARLRAAGFNTSINDLIEYVPPEN